LTSLVNPPKTSNPQDFSAYLAENQNRTKCPPEVKAFFAVDRYVARNITKRT